MPKLTIAIPTYNREKMLAETLKSISTQTFRDFEIVLLDNASEYDVDELVQMFPDLNITVERTNENIGNLANFERAAARAYTTPYVMIFHDDDTIHPAYLADAIDFLDKNPDCTWVGSTIRFTKDHSQMMKFGETHRENIHRTERSEFVRDILTGLNIGFCSIIYRSDLLSPLDNYTKKFGKWCDRPYIIDASSPYVGISKFDYINYRLHADQDSQAMLSAQDERYKSAIENYYKDLASQVGIDPLTWSTNNAFTAQANSITEYFAKLRALHRNGDLSIAHIRPIGIARFARKILQAVVRTIK